MQRQSGLPPRVPFFQSWSHALVHRPSGTRFGSLSGFRCSVESSAIIIHYIPVDNFGQTIENPTFTAYLRKRIRGVVYLYKGRFINQAFKTMNELDKIPAQQPQVIVPLVDLVQGYIEARDRIKQYDEEYDKQVVPLKEAREHFKGEIVKVFKERKEFSTRVQGATVS